MNKYIKKNKSFEFIYIGADIDSYAAGNDIGIRKDNIANFKKDIEGTSKMFKAVSSFELCMMDEEASINWKKELDEYLEENK